MSTTPSRPNGDAAPAPPVFSYAQAAKGRAASTTASAMQSHQSTASGISTPAKEPHSTINTPSAGSERGDRSVNGSVEAPSKVEVTESSRNTETKPSTSLKPSSSTASPSFGTASTSTLPKEDKDDDFTLVGGPDLNRDRHSAAAEKNADGEGRRAKKGKKQKNAEKETEKETEKEKEEVKPEVFVPAPLPSVNFWQQRKEEAAKAKPSPVVAQSPQAVGPNSGDLNSTPNGKTAEKKRGKNEETSSPSLNGTPKDLQSANRGQKKGGDTPGKKEDPSGKRAGARGSRANEKDEKAAASQLPPPVEDAMSWPTPETALEEEKRKAQEKFEKEDKDETVSNKPRPKEKWVAVPYTPSVTFNTPLPTRGGRGRGGARGGRTEAGGRTGHSTNGTSEKPQNASITEGSPADRDSRSSSVPPTTKSRPSTEPSSGRKPSVAQGGEKAKTSSSKNESTSDIRNLPNGGQPDQSFEVSQDTRGDNKGLKQEQNFFENQPYQRSSADRKVDQSMRAPDQFKDNSNLNKDGLNQARGNDGQSNRGRGGFRGRAGHGAFANGQPHPQNVFTNGHGGPPPSNGYPVRQASGPYSPPLQPLPFSNQYAPPPSRGGRGGSRSQSIPNNGMYGRYPPNGGLAQHMSPIQTSNLYDYQHMQGPMSAQPYQPYMDQVSVLQMVTMQLEYYFSIDNLCKDVFLRKHMDSQGFVFLAFIAGFKRIQALTQEFELLRFACQESSIIELVRGDDGHDRLRRKEGWEKWVFKGMEERDESVRNAGPTFHQRSQQSQHRGSMVMPNQQTMSPVAFSANGTEAGFHQYTNGNGIPAPVLSNGNGGAYFPETPLSAAVPDFSPGVLPTLSNGGTSEPLDIETTFSDDEVAHLILVFKAPKSSEDSKPKSPFHSMPSRTFSNGSIDGRSIAEELYDDQRQSRSLVNGSHASETGSPDSLRRPRSPFGAMSPTQSSFNNGPPVMWVKGQKQQAFVSPGSSEELYTKFRARALQHRETSAPGESHADMKLLYEFWSHFLCRNFNAAMYQEFRNFAFEDAQSKAMSGVTSLISYYAEVLSSKKKVIPSVLALHYVDLVKNEDPSGPRPALEKLRVAWRDGALDMKSRKRIDNLVDSKLREELERAPHQKSDLS